MEGVFSMSPKDRAGFSLGIKLLPYLIDAKGISLCRRPRLWWFNWVVKSQEGVSVFPPQTDHCEDYGVIDLFADVQPKEFLNPGWTLTSPGYRFCTFTTAQPKNRPGLKPAGIAACTPADLGTWACDRFRFPPYAYQFCNGVIHRKKGWRMLSIAEKEAIMGMPVDYTLHANTKQQRKSNPQGCDDDRMTLVGNAWHVGVVAFLLSNLLAKEGFCSPVSPKDLVNHLKSGSSVSL